MFNANPALESIAFQKSDLFVAITNCLDKIRKLNSKLDDDKFYSTPEVRELTEIIQNRTGLLFNFIHMDRVGPAVFVPRLAQTIFDDSEELKSMMELWDDFDKHYTLKKVLKALDAQIVEGIVDLKNSKVTGVFTKIKSKMVLPKDYLFNKKFSNEELAAIVLHEIGHVFTSFECLTRTVSTNQSLAIMIKSMDKSIRYDDRKIILAKAKDKLNLTDEELEILLNDSNPNKTALIVMGGAIRQSKSELGASVYDANSCEYLADQFAARHGAGKFLVTALDKLMGTSSSEFFDLLISGLIFVTLSLFMTMFTGVMAIGVLMGLWFTVATMTNASDFDVSWIYDNNYTRYSRIKHQMVQQLKDPQLDKDVRDEVVRYIDEIDPIIQKNIQDTDIKVRNKIAMFISSTHKRDFEYMRLQKDLELLGNNDLYVMSQKLKTV